jgi:hypothetical protein
MDTDVTQKLPRQPSPDVEREEFIGKLAAGPAPRPQMQAPSGSIAADLAARRAKIAHERVPSLDLDVPDMDGHLLVRYRYPEPGYKPLTQAIERAQTSKDHDAGLWANCDVLALACETVLGRDPQGHLADIRTGRLLDPDEVLTPPLRFNRELAGLLQIEVPEEIKSPPRYVIRAVFSPRGPETGVWDGDLALMTTGGRVISWLQREEQEIGREFSGE